jgi:hypothetical protein
LWNLSSARIAKSGSRATWNPRSYLQVHAEGYELTLVQERSAFDRQGNTGAHTLELALIIESPIVALLYRFGESYWKHLYYVLPLARDQGPARAFVQKPWPPRREARLRVRVVEPFEHRVLLDETTSLDPEFSGILHRALRDQAETSFDPTTYVRTVTLLSLSHPTPASLHDRALATTTLPI